MREYFFSPPEGVANRGKTGILLTNLGTPEQTTYRSIRSYLIEFLSDRRVIEMAPAFWQPLLRGPVLALRPFRVGRNYKKIWNKKENASPLRVITRNQAEKLASRLKDRNIAVAWGMRYGTPSVKSAVDELVAQGCDKIVSIALYPQYSATTTATANDQIFRALMRMRLQPSVHTVPSFPDHPLYIQALANAVEREFMNAELGDRPERLVVSFHGIPQSCARKGDPYRRECERTVEALRLRLKEMGICQPHEVLLTFQSRFGPEEWLRPYTDETVKDLAASGIKNIAVIAPGFMADCIETLDELGREVKEEFLHAGGRRYGFIPCINDSEDAIDLLQALSENAAKGF